MILAIAIMLVIATIASARVKSVLEKDFNSRLGLANNQLNAQQKRLSDLTDALFNLEAELNAKTQREDYFREAMRLQQEDVQLLKEASDNSVSAQAIDNLSDELFTLKSALESLRPVPKQKSKKVVKKSSKKK